MPMMLDEKALDELNSLRDEWAICANTLGKMHGENDPAARAFRLCISRLYEVMERRGMSPGAVVRGGPGRDPHDLAGYAEYRR